MFTSRIFRRASSYALMGLLMAFLGVFLIYPIALTVSGGVTETLADGTTRFTLRHIGMVFRDPTLVGAMLNSLRMAMTTTTVAMLIGVPLAILSAKYTFPGKGFFSAVILVPLILPPFVGAIGMQALLGREGAINALLGLKLDFLGNAKFWGVVIVDALHLYPIIYLNATAALANLDPALDEAAENLGCGPWRRLFRVTLPLVRPGIFAGATIVFIWSFTELGTPLIFDYTQVLPVQVFNRLKEVESASPEPYALVIVMFTAAVGLYLLGKKVLSGSSYAMYSKASRAATMKELSGARGWGATAWFSVITLLALLPHIGVVLTSLTGPGQWYGTVLPSTFTLHNYGQALGHPDAFASIVNSLKLSVMAVMISVVFGVLAAYVIARTTLKGRWLLDALCMLPLAVPGIVVAFGYVAMSLRWPFGSGPGGPNPLSFISVFGGNPNPMVLLVVAFGARRMPYIVRSAVAGLQQTSGELEEAAMNLGAGKVMAVRRVILPLIAGNIIAGALLAFSFAMLAVSEPLILAQQPADYPITRQIYAFMNRLGDGPFVASAMGVWGMALLTVTLVGASVLMGKKLGSIFRA